MTWPHWGRAAFVFVVAVLFVSAVAQIWLSPIDDVSGGRITLTVLAAGFTLPLLVARHHPLVALVAILAAAWTAGWLELPLGQPWFAMLLAVFALGAHATLRSSAFGMTAVAAAVLSLDLPRLQQGAAIDDVLPAWFVVGGSWAFGRWIQTRRRDQADLVARAEALERDREQATRAAVAYERARIARELHDMVAHSLAVIVLQAQAAERVLDTDLTGARKALGSIESIGRQGLGELRRLLEVLVADDADALDPRPSLQHLDQLVERVREAGLPVEVAVEGEPRPLPPGIDLSAYRIVQEALTNTLKHAGPARAVVGLSFRAEALEVRVTDDGSGVQSPEASTRIGHGLIGMRERVSLYGGTLDTGHRSGGGFSVLARLPLSAAPS
jgi:signal transduction histidine kinase